MSRLKSFFVILCLLLSFSVSADPKTWIVTTDPGTKIGGIHATQQTAIDAASAQANSTPDKKYWVMGLEIIAVKPTAALQLNPPDPVP